MGCLDGAQLDRQAKSARVDAGALVLNPESPWHEWTSPSDNSLYWHNAPFEKSKELPAEGVKLTVGKSEAEFQIYWQRWFGEGKDDL